MKRFMWKSNGYIVVIGIQLLLLVSVLLASVTAIETSSERTVPSKKIKTLTTTTTAVTTAATTATSTLASSSRSSSTTSEASEYFSTSEPSSTVLAAFLSSTSEPMTESSSTSSISTPEICTRGLKVVMSALSSSPSLSPSPSPSAAAQQSQVDGQTVVKHDSDLVQKIEGDAMVSVLTTDPTSALFVINRVNFANLLEAEFEIGVRAILIENAAYAENILMQEIEYLQQCITHSMGVFIDYDLYKPLENVIKDLEYNIWPIPSARTYIFPKVAHLLYQMPWGDQIASVEIHTENLEIYNDFTESVRHEHMCLMHFKSENNVYILFGNKMANHFNENGTIFAVLTEHTDLPFIADLADDSFVFMEKPIDLRIIDQNSTHITLDVVLIGKSMLTSRVLAFAQPILDLVRWLRASLQRNCKRLDDSLQLETCFNYLTFLSDWNRPENRQRMETAKVVELLKLKQLMPLLNFQLYQKKFNTSELREIASQSFVTNVTTFYHYNAENSSGVELKTKFGQIFNCQYSSGDNARYPFLFDGESVMFWRLKTDAWVATGITAAILGVIITLAILVFIVVRISLGDVFEGNPVTSILLLLSLILVFTSFVPFSMEYVGEQRNSHVTYEDAGILNTLCAVRVFVLTLVYCFTFSLLLCRAVMLASIGSEGGFLSHVNGYIQAVICLLSILVQFGMSVQMIVVMHIASKETISCENMYYGHWLWYLMAYDFLLLVCIVSLVPFIYRSQRNYREGILIVIGGVLSLIIWLVWVILAFFGDEMRDAAIPLGLQATGWALLIGVLIPRTFLIVRGIERADIAQALPSLTSLAFAQNNQYTSEHSVYECVNPAMRNLAPDEYDHQSPSEIPTLPLRGGGPRRQQFFANLRQANASINPQRPPPRPQRTASPTQSLQSSLPPSPDNSKITRF